MELAAALLVGAALGFRAGVSLNDEGGQQQGEEQAAVAEEAPSEVSEADAAAAAAAAEAMAQEVPPKVGEEDEKQEEAYEPPWKKARGVEAAPAHKWEWNSVDRKWEKVNPSSSSNQAPQQKEEQWKPPEELDLRWCDRCESYGYLRKRACVNIQCVSQLQKINF